MEKNLQNHQTEKVKKEHHRLHFGSQMKWRKKENLPESKHKIK